MTNYEKVKNMSIEEMAERIHKVNKECLEVQEFCQFCIYCNRFICDGIESECINGIKEWLESEAEK